MAEKDYILQVKDLQKYYPIKSSLGAVKGYNKGFQKGASSVGIKQGAINTWNGLSTGQKIGVGALGTAAVALPVIAISRANNKRREAEEDLERERRRR